MRYKNNDRQCDPLFFLFQHTFGQCCSVCCRWTVFFSSLLCLFVMWKWGRILLAVHTHIRTHRHYTQTNRKFNNPTDAFSALRRCLSAWCCLLLLLLLVLPCTLSVCLKEADRKNKLESDFFPFHVRNKMKRNISVWKKKKMYRRNTNRIKVNGRWDECRCLPKYRTVAVYLYLSLALSPSPFLFRCAGLFGSSRARIVCCILTELLPFIFINVVYKWLHSHLGW